MIIGDWVFRNGEDIISEEFYGLLPFAESPFTTVVPGRQQYFDTFAQLAGRSRNILALTVSSYAEQGLPIHRILGVDCLEGGALDRSLDSIIVEADGLIPKSNLIAFARDLVERYYKRLPQ